MCYVTIAEEHITKLFDHHKQCTTYSHEHLQTNKMHVLGPAAQMLDGRIISENTVNALKLQEDSSHTRHKSSTGVCLSNKSHQIHEQSQLPDKYNIASKETYSWI